MRKKVNKGLIISLFFTIVTLVTVTFSWIIDTQGSEGRHVVIDYGENSGHDLVIAPDTLSVAIGTKNSEGDFIELNNDNLFELDGLIPAEPVTFYIRFYNRGDKALKIKAYFASIIAEEVLNKEGNATSLLDVTYIYAYPTINNEDEQSKGVHLFLADVSRMSLVGNNLSYLFLENIIIPTTGEQGFYEYTCSFIMDAQADNTYQNLNLDIKVLKIVC